MIFIVWVAFIRLEQKTKSKHKEKYVKKKKGNVVMPSEETKILESYLIRKSDKAFFFVYANLESWIKMTDGCKYNPEKKFTRKINEHTRLKF